MMAKNQFLNLLFFMLFPFLAVYGQGWERSFGGTEADIGQAVIQSQNGYFLITGSKGDSVVVLTTNAWGELLWQKTYAPKGSGYAIQETPEGNFVIAGDSRADYLLFQIDPSGQLLWEKTFGGNTIEQARGLALTTDGGFILTGSSTPGLQDSPQMTLVKVDKQTNIEWQKTFGGNVGHDVKVVADKGYIIGSTAEKQGDHFAKVLKTDRLGQLEWEFSKLTSPGSLLNNIQVTPDGTCVFAHSYKNENPSNNFSEDIFLIQLDAEGNQQWEKIYGDPQIDETAYALIQTSDGGFAISGTRKDNLLLIKTDGEGKLLWEKKYGGDYIDRGFQTSNTTDGGYLLTGQTNASFTPEAWEIFLVKTDREGRTLTNYVEGQVWNDRIANCTLDANETGLKNWIVQAYNSGRTYSGTTDAKGHFLIPVESGTYTVELTPPSQYWKACQNQLSTVTLVHYDTATLAFPIQTIIDCPQLTVDISTPFLRRCFDNVYEVQYANEGTRLAGDASVEITFDDFLVVNSSSIPWVDKDGQTYTFDLGDVDWGTSGTFQIHTSLDCATTLLGQTHCVEARIFPDALCLPPDPVWDGSDIIVSGYCDVDTVRFEIQNIGTGDMINERDYIIVEDQIILRTGKYQLLSGQSKAVAVAANGATYRLETTQAPGHPVGNLPSATVEACNANSSGNSSIGFVNQYPQDDVASSLSIDCQENQGAFDPNDKRGFPLGYGTKHLIEPSTDLEYLIRFQNTGSDTAFRVVVVDTLSVYLDLRTLVPGASSHPYHFELLDNRTLRFTFDTIRLPDSQTNEAASHGFIKFRCQQIPGNPRETLIENQAAIYFDFNAPIISNKTSHRVDTCFITGCFVTSTYEPELSKFSVTIAPNPFDRETNFSISPAPQEAIQFFLYDVQGRLLRREQHRGSSFRFQRGELPDGIYFYRLLIDATKNFGGKVVLK